MKVLQVGQVYVTQRKNLWTILDIKYYIDGEAFVYFYVGESAASRRYICIREIIAKITIDKLL